MKKKLKKLKELRKGLDTDKSLIKKQHDKGKLTAEERIDKLLDQGSFIELNEFSELESTDFGLDEKKKPRDGVITGYGTINQRQVFVYAQDFTFMGGSMGAAHNKKIANVIEHSLKTGCPVIGLLDSGGARIQEGVAGLDGGGRIFYNNTLASGAVPQISAILGPCAGIAAYSPALTDFVFMTDKVSKMFITGPDVIRSVTGEKTDFESLGGAFVHNQKSGNAHFMADDEEQCFDMIKQLLSYLPQNNLETPPVNKTGQTRDRKHKVLETIVPDDPKASYDMKGVIEEIFDKNSFFEINQGYAQNIIVGLARLDNNVVGIIANQPKILAGCLDIGSSDKISRFVRLCDSFNIPLVNLVDVTGYLPGVDQEHNGIIRHGAKILYAFSEATVPKISLVIRKAYGGAYIALVSKEMGFDKVLAWPTAEIAVMGADQAVNIINRKELKGKNPDKLRKKKTEEFSDKFLNPYVAAKEGRVDKVIEPKDTRKSLVGMLEMMANKRERRPAKKHGNMPL